MELMQVRRWQADGKATIGQFYIRGEHYGFCLEPALVKPYHNHFCDCCQEPHPRIPAGKYRVGLRNSPHFGKDVPQVLNVPGRTYVLFHIGNTAKDTKACFCPGLHYQPGTWEVRDSRVARDHLYDEIRKAVKGNEEIWLEVIDAFDPPKAVA